MISLRQAQTDNTTAVTQSLSKGRAYASYEENTKGSIESGKHADLVVLGRDPYKENPSTLVTIPIERTMAGGKWVYES